MPRAHPDTPHHPTAPAGGTADPQGVNPRSLAALNRLIMASEPMVRGGSRAVLGEGPIGAELAFVGEQPGDQEDRLGHPFVGPAGRIFDRALEAAGIDRRKSYITNAVKHFKHEQRGKRRIHQKPTMGEVKRYRWWLLKELEFVHPELVVALGATAASALTGAAITISRSRGPARFDMFPGFITVHPSSLLRIRDEEDRALAYDTFVKDLRSAHRLAEA